ncbi:SAM-dependent methyltransferase [Nocardia sp. NPDC024068]|uniref:SAM-dependent methyltransferase n=1 Tax=Nocardia sp. NPDC024068 TaxID=3157197 RepID=UPI0033C4CBCE
MPEDHRPTIRTDIPHSARIWNYWMGGDDYFEADRLAGEAGIAVDPDITTMAVESRQFLIRTVRFLAAEKGIRQFLDIGAGLPSMQNTHQVAQSVAPDSRIVYIDNDPLVLAHARTLLAGTTDEGVTTYSDADYRNSELVVADARHVLNFTTPLAVMFMGVLGHAASAEEMRRIVRTVLDATPSGSYLVLWDGTDDSADYVKLCSNYTDTGGAPYVPRPRAEIRAAFDGLALEAPGFVSITQWRPDTGDSAATRPISAYGGVARKP